MFSINKTYKILFVINILILSTVYYIEYGMGVYACNLCKYQRIPYFLNLIILTFLIFDKIKFFKFLYVLILSISINILISFYHVGIEQKIFSETEVCSIKKNTNNTSDLLKQLEKQGMSGCSKVTFRLFGLSLSTLNLLTNLSFLVICIYIFRNEQRQKN